MVKDMVVQSNKLIEAHYKQEYTVQEQRTILWLISQIHKEDQILTKKYEHKLLQISAKKYADMIGIPVSHVYRDAQKIGEGLMEKSIKIETEQGWEIFNWMSSMKYRKTEAIIELLISPTIIPYIINLKEQFTSFKLENILYLQSTYAIKLYQILTQYKSIGTRTVSIDLIRSILGISFIKSYSNYADLKRRILDISKREINEKTDLNISYSEIKKGRKVESIKFKITSKQKPEINLDKEIITTVTALDSNSKQIRLSTIVLEDAKQIANEAGTGWDIYEIEKQFQDYAKKKSIIKNPEGAFIGFVKKKVAKQA